MLQIIPVRGCQLFVKRIQLIDQHGICRALLLCEVLDMEDLGAEVHFELEYFVAVFHLVLILGQPIFLPCGMFRVLELS